MQRTNVIELKPKKKQIKILKEMMLLSSSIYNMANYIVRHEIFNNEKTSSFIDLRHKLQNTTDYKLLGRSYSLPRLQIYGETNSARFKLIKSKTQKEVGLPKYMKNRKTNTTIPSFLAIDGCQYCIRKNKVRIPLSRQMRKEYELKKFEIEYNGVLKHQGEQKRGQIHFKDGKFYLYQSVEIETPKIKKTKVIASIDIGIKNLISILINNGEEKIIGSKRFLRQWKYYEDLIAIEQEKLSKINIYSSNNLLRLYELRKKYQTNVFNNIVARTFRFLKRNNVSKIIIGDIKNIREDNDKGKEQNQMTHNYWSFDKLLQKIKNKSEEFGIEIQMVTEEYTSQTCPICFDRNKNYCKDRIFVCDFCGYVEHRDIVGARNIMLKGMCDLTKMAHWCEIAPLTEVIE